MKLDDFAARDRRAGTIAGQLGEYGICCNAPAPGRTLSDTIKGRNDYGAAAFRDASQPLKIEDHRRYSGSNRQRFPRTQQGGLSLARRAAIVANYLQPLDQIDDESRLPRAHRRQRFVEQQDAGIGRYRTRHRDALGLDRLILVGHSMGGMIAAEMAALAPREV